MATVNGAMGQRMRSLVGQGWRGMKGGHGLGMAVLPLIEYNMARGEGHGMPYSLGRAAAFTYAFAKAPGAMMILPLIGAIRPLASAIISGSASMQRSLIAQNRPFGNRFVDNPYGAMERQAMVQEAMSSGAKGRSIIGRESALFSRRYG